MPLAEMKHMPQPESRSFDNPDQSRIFGHGRVDVVKLGGVAFGRATLEPGWRWSTCVKPIANTASCEVPQLNLHISGRLHVEMDDGSEYEFGPGEIASLPAGHDAWVVGDEPVVMIDVSVERWL
jgi:uncharacterized cupin superfamily protein